MYFFVFKKYERDEKEIVGDERFSMSIAVPSVQSYSARESARTHTLFLNDVE